MKKLFEKLLFSLNYRLHKINFKNIKGNNNTIINAGLLEGCKIEIYGNNNTITIGPDSIIKNSFFYINGNNLSIQFDSNVKIKRAEFWAEDNNGTIEIKSNTTIEEAHIALTENNSKISIGYDCMIANGVEIRNGDSHAIYDKNQNRINKPSDISIGNHVWIANRAIILKGTTIESDAIIGAASVVCGTVLSNTIVAGNPIKLIKSNIHWTRQR